MFKRSRNFLYDRNFMQRLLTLGLSPFQSRYISHHKQAWKSGILNIGSSIWIIRVERFSRIKKRSRDFDSDSRVFFRMKTIWYDAEFDFLSIYDVCDRRQLDCWSLGDPENFKRHSATFDITTFKFHKVDDDDILWTRCRIEFSIDLRCSKVWWYRLLIANWIRRRPGIFDLIWICSGSFFDTRGYR